MWCWWCYCCFVGVWSGFVWVVFFVFCVFGCWGFVWVGCVFGVVWIYFNVFLIVCFVVVCIGWGRVVVVDVERFDVYSEWVVVVICVIVSLFNCVFFFGVVSRLDVKFDVYGGLRVIFFIDCIGVIECVNGRIVNILSCIWWGLFNCVIVLGVLRIVYIFICVVVVVSCIFFVEVIGLYLVDVVVKLFLIDFI